jgi:FrmR/RcnR family transcriptional regulator, repressor of frmRAB operon
MPFADHMSKGSSPSCHATSLQLGFSFVSGGHELIGRGPERTPCRRPRAGRTLGREPGRSRIGKIQQLPWVAWEERVLDATREKSKLVNRVRRIRGQVEAIERALEQETGCSDTLRLIASVRGAINGLMAEVLEDHIRTRVIDPL